MSRVLTGLRYEEFNDTDADSVRWVMLSGAKWSGGERCWLHYSPHGRSGRREITDKMDEICGLIDRAAFGEGGECVSGEKVRWRLIVETDSFKAAICGSDHSSQAWADFMGIMRFIGADMHFFEDLAIINKED